MVQKSTIRVITFGVDSRFSLNRPKLPNLGGEGHSRWGGSCAPKAQQGITWCVLHEHLRSFQEMDIAAASITITSQRSEAVDFTYPFWHEYSSVAVKVNSLFVCKCKWVCGCVG